MTAFTTDINGKSLIEKARVGSPLTPGPVIFQNVFDAALRNVTTSDTVQVLELPLGLFVSEVLVEILTADAGGGGINVGDGAQAAGYGVYATLSSAAKLAIAAGSATTYLYTNTTNAKVKPKLIAAANDQKVLLAATGATATTLKVKVTVLGFFA